MLPLPVGSDTPFFVGTNDERKERSSNSVFTFGRKAGHSPTCVRDQLHACW